MATSPRPAIILSSGGLDSTTCLAIARSQNFSPLYSLSFDYDQRHRHELAAAQRIAQLFQVHEHKTIHLDLRQFGHSALTDNLDVPKDRSESQMSHDIPITYVPARNTIFLSYALAFAEVKKVLDIFIGVNAIDYSGYPDCRPEFIQAFEKMANLATAMTTQSQIGNRKSQIKIHTPLIHLTKSQIIQLGTQLGVDYSLTHSCYDPDQSGRACGRCDSCLLRKKGFQQAQIPDPTIYQ